MKKIALISVVVALSGLAAVGVGAVVATRMLNTPLMLSKGSTLFEVTAGSSFTDVAEQLADRGIVAHPRLLVWYARLTGHARHISAGEYALKRGLTPRGLLQKLVAGQVYLHQFTIIEGWRFKHLLQALREDPAIKATGLDGKAIMARLGEPALSPEGEFLPNTYKFPKGTTDIEFLRRAHEALSSTLARIWKQRGNNCVLDNAYQALILASIIEKETALASERRKIAGVFTERLKRGMRLQADPTVIYGLGDHFNGDLTSEDLATDTPYNTYTRAGLPPTPIALPGRASLKAAVHPEMTGALYFVATGLPDGSHDFSRTLAEHDAAVRRYLKRIAEQ